MIVGKVLSHFRNRKSEYATSSMMLLLGVHIAIFPTAVAASAFREILDVLPEAWLCIGFLLAGSLRMVALIANGKWERWPHHGPLLRAAGALAGAMIWSQMCLALCQLVVAPMRGAPPSPGIPVYFVLTCLELISMYEALLLVNLDARDDAKRV